MQVHFGASTICRSAIYLFDIFGSLAIGLFAFGILEVDKKRCTAIFFETG
jgi:hypothetical protein